MPGSRISGGASTWAWLARAAAISKAATEAKLLLCINNLPWLVWRIGDGADIISERRNVGFVQSLTVRGHFSGFPESLATVLNECQEIGVAQFVQISAVAECMGLASKIVVVRDSFRRRFGVVTARAINFAQLPALILLETQGQFFGAQFDGFPASAGCRGGDHIPAGHAAQGDGCCE